MLVHGCSTLQVYAHTPDRLPCCMQAFKEAAKLAADIKACASEAEACNQKAAQAQASAEGAEEECAAQEAAVAREQASIAAAQHGVALAQWRRLQVQNCWQLLGRAWSACWIRIMHKDAGCHLSSHSLCFLRICLLHFHAPISSDQELFSMHERMWQHLRPSMVSLHTAELQSLERVPWPQCN